MLKIITMFISDDNLFCDLIKIEKNNITKNTISPLNPSSFRKRSVTTGRERDAGMLGVESRAGI